MDAFTHDFGFSTPATCYRNSWGSPHRLYFVKSTDDGANTRFEFMVTTQGCQYKNSPCCNATLDHMVIKTGAQDSRRADR